MKESSKARIIHDVKLLFVLLLVIAAYAFVIIPVLIFAEDFDLVIIGSIIGSGVALVTGIFALLKDYIIDTINEPRLKIEFYPNDKRDCHATDFRDRNTGQVVAKTHYFRIRVVNYGWRTAEDVEVSLEEVKRKDNKRFETDTDFMPLRLYWSHWKAAKFELSIPSGAYRHCDLGFILDPSATLTPLPSEEDGKVLFWFDVITRPNTGRTSLLPGEYQVVISAFGKNAKRASITINLSWKGTWNKDLNKLLSEGIFFS